jgi:hypothetical protein
MSEIYSEASPGGLRIVKGTDKRPEIVITQELSDVTDRAAQCLARDEAIYQRGGSLVHVVVPTPMSTGERAFPAIRNLATATLRVRLSQIARWLRVDAKGTHKRVNVPDIIVQAVMARGQWDDVRPLVGVITAPTIRPDGTVLQMPGYDPSTSLLLWPSEAYAVVDDEPTREEAIAAAHAIMDVACDFPFARDHDRTAWLASVLTLVGRHAISGPTPLFCIDANTRGSGKSRLVDVAVAISSGAKAARTSLSNNDEEIRKQITSLLSEGSPAALIDNVRSGATFGGPAFDALLTSDVWKDRRLGQNDVILTLPARAVWFATGNNLRFAGDLSRRTVRIRLHSKLEDPEKRTDFKHGAGDALLSHVARMRKFLVAQALIILRAHAVAGKPSMGDAWGSFESWSRVAVDPIRWCGLADPMFARATEDEGSDEDRWTIAAIVAALESVNRPVSAREFLTELYPHDRAPGTSDLFPTYAAARDAIEDSVGPKGAQDSMRVGRLLQRLRGRIVDGKLIEAEMDRHAKIKRWRVSKSD